jgi:hypothetical protein
MRFGIQKSLAKQKNVKTTGQTEREFIFNIYYQILRFLF